MTTSQGKPIVRKGQVGQVGVGGNPGHFAKLQHSAEGLPSLGERGNSDASYNIVDPRYSDTGELIPVDYALSETKLSALSQDLTDIQANKSLRAGQKEIMGEMAEALREHGAIKNHVNLRGGGFDHTLRFGGGGRFGGEPVPRNFSHFAQEFEKPVPSAADTMPKPFAFTEEDNEPDILADAPLYDGGPLQKPVPEKPVDNAASRIGRLFGRK